ncbi:MAG: OmpH family outer membrane protein [Lentisphaeria bacterium]|jgi:Skp family chaperone for outer membrane proteins|nr:OmpH family outer membrane protein [Lentisphaeria bacterium]MBQ9775864.1 OmpH family outer membrane protein [Lentisphaeria bacterium]
MMKKQIFLFLCCFAVFCAEAAPRFGVVNYEKIFREYYKSKIAEDTIRRQGEVYRNYLLKLNEQHQQLQKEASALLINSQNVALSNEERQRSRSTLEAKRKEIQQKKAEIELYAKERTQDLRRIEAQKRKEITDEINAAVKRRAAAEKFDFVFDASGRTLNQQPALLVYPEYSDLTERVIIELNRPAAGKNTTQKPQEKK